MDKIEPEETISLKRSLNLPLLIFYGVGTILGLGIYVLLGKIAGEAGMMAPLSFLLAAILAGFTGFSYGELAARIPKSAGEVNYVDQAFHKKYLSMAVGWLIVISAIVSTATVVNGYVGYVHEFVQIPAWLIISGITLVLGGIAVWGITESAATITIITFIEISGILLVIFISGDNLSSFSTRWHEFIPDFSLADWKGIMMGAFLAFFTFIGFEDLVNVAEEVKNPQKNLPKAIVISLVVLTVLYVLVAIIAGLGLSPERLYQSDAPLADILRREGAVYPKIISLISLIAIVNGVLVQIVMGARVLYGMAKKEMAPQIFQRLNPKTRTPVWSTVFATGFILALALLFKLESLAKATNYILLVVFIMVNLSLWVLKKKNPAPENVKTYPKIVPVMGFFLSLAILIFQLVSSLMGNV